MQQSSRQRAQLMLAAFTSVPKSNLLSIVATYAQCTAPNPNQPLACASNVCIRMAASRNSVEYTCLSSMPDLASEAISITSPMFSKVDSVLMPCGKEVARGWRCVNRVAMCGPCAVVWSHVARCEARGEGRAAEEAAQCMGRVNMRVWHTHHVSNGMCVAWRGAAPTPSSGATPDARVSSAT